MIQLVYLIWNGGGYNQTYNGRRTCKGTADTIYPPEGMTSDEVRDMSDEDLLDMDYFLHEFDDIDDDDFGEEGFYIF